MRLYIDSPLATLPATDPKVQFLSNLKTTFTFAAVLSTNSNRMGSDVANSFQKIAEGVAEADKENKTSEDQQISK